jgi:hypothetical protein
LQEAAGRLGWTVVANRDEGISGTKGRDKRPALDALLKGLARRKFDIVAGTIGVPVGPIAAKPDPVARRATGAETQSTADMRTILIGCP